MFNFLGLHIRRVIVIAYVLSVTAGFGFYIWPYFTEKRPQRSVEMLMLKFVKDDLSARIDSLRTGVDSLRTEIDLFSDILKVAPVTEFGTTDPTISLTVARLDEKFGFLQWRLTSIESNLDNLKNDIDKKPDTSRLSDEVDRVLNGWLVRTFFALAVFLSPLIPMILTTLWRNLFFPKPEIKDPQGDN